MSSPRARLLTSLVFLLVVTAVLGTVYGRYGEGGEDGIFIQALSFRIVNGQLPHADFIYVRPPGSPLLHAIPMLLVPFQYQVLFERYLFYFTVALYSLLSVSILNRTFRWDIGEGLHLLMAGSFTILSILNFPPMPWHTTDGIFFSVLGIWILTRFPSRWGVAAGTLSLGLAVFCKQSFVFVLPAALVWLILTRERAAWVVAVFTGIVASALGLGFFAGAGMYDDAVKQIFGASSPGSLFHAGVTAYLRQAHLSLIPAVAVGAIAWVIPRARPAVPYLFAGTVLIPAGVVWLRADAFRAAPFNFPAALFLVALISAFLELKKDRTAAATLLLMLSVSWCASLSWGYQTPALYSAPILFALIHRARRMGAAPVPFAASLLVFALFLQWAGYQHPYRDAQRSDLKHSMHLSVQPQRGIYSSENNFERYWESARFAVNHESFAVIPGFPGMHYYAKKVPPLSIDWARDGEVGSQLPRLIEELEQERPRVLLERGAGLRCDHNAACSSLALWVESNWELVEEGRFFDVYEAP